MDATRVPECPEALHKIVAVDHAREALIVVFDDGKEFIFHADVLYGLIPSEARLAEQIKKLLG